MKLAKINLAARNLKRRVALASAIVSSLPAGFLAAADKYWVGPWGTWSNAANWSPNGMPAPGDAVNIGDLAFVNNLQVFLDVNPNLSKLHLFNGIWMDNQQHPITVSGATTIAGYQDNWSRLWLRDAVNPYDLSTGNLNVLVGSSIFTVGTPTIFVHGTMNLDADSSLVGSAIINFTGDDDPVLIMNGRWSSNPVDSLTLNQMGTGRIDLDGSTILDNFLLTAGTSAGVYQTLTINGTALTDEFDDIFWVSNGNQLNMNLSEGWALGGSGKIWLRDTGRTESAKVNGGTLTVNGTIEFETGLGDINQMLADINAPTVFNFGSDVIVGGWDTLNVNGASTVNSGSFALVGNGNNRLKFNGPTKLQGGTFTTTTNNSEVQFNGATQWAGGTVTINGRAVQNGTATVTAATVINAKTLDMDGDTQLTTWNVYAPLTINAEKLDISDNLMSGTINVSSSLFSPASLIVNLPAGQKWTAGGLVKLTGSGLGVSTTLAGSDVGFGGGLEVTRANAIAARADFLLGSLTTINTNSALHLTGGTIAAPNTIAGAWMEGAGTLAAATGKALVGHGTISTAIDFEGSAELRAKSGTLRLGGAIHDVGVIGTADATGILHVTQPWNSAAADKVELKGGQIVGATLTNDRHIAGHGTLGMAHLVNNGSIAASGGAATLTINVTSLVGPDLDGTSESGQLHAVNGNIRVIDFVEPFHGTAHVGSGKTLRFDNGWTNNGTTILTGTSASPATLSSGATQSLGGTLHVDGAGKLAGPTTFTGTSNVTLDVAGTLPAVQFDRLTSDGSVTLGGMLSLTIGTSYNPAYLVPHEVISVDQRNGTFATIGGVAFAPDKYLAVTYDADSVFVTAALPGDADLSGSVNLADFNVLASNFGLAGGATWSAGDFTGDGVVNLADFNALAGSFGLSAAAATAGAPSSQDWSALAAAVPEPATSGAAAVSLAGGLLGRWRRRSRAAT